MSEEERNYGIFVLEDGNPPAADYTPARKVRVEIGFNGTLTEMAAKAEQARIIATQQINAALGRSVAVRGATAEEASSPEQQRRRRRTQAEIAADKAAEDAAKAGAQPNGEPGGEPTSADPFEEINTTAQVGGGAETTDEWDTGAPAAPEVTDADLGAACSKKNAVLKDPDKIRDLINTYNPDPNKVFQLREIPQDKRADFLAKLETLK